MQDLLASLKPELAKASSQITATGSSSTIIDMKGFSEALFIILSTVVAAADGSNFLTFSLEHGDQANLSDAADVAAPDVTAQGISGSVGASFALNATTTVGYCGKIQYKGQKRYVRLKYTETGTFDGTFSAVVLKGEARNLPVAA